MGSHTSPPFWGAVPSTERTGVWLTVTPILPTHRRCWGRQAAGCHFPAWSRMTICKHHLQNPVPREARHPCLTHSRNWTCAHFNSIEAYVPSALTPYPIKTSTSNTASLSPSLQYLEYSSLAFWTVPADGAATLEKSDGSSRHETSCHHGNWKFGSQGHTQETRRQMSAQKLVQECSQQRYSQWRGNCDSNVRPFRNG